MRESKITRDEAFELLKKYNKDPFHIRHALTVEGVMRWYAKELGYADEEEYWGIVGLLHDIDFVAEPGKTTAIIGSTGCGKSTLLNTLAPTLHRETGQISQKLGRGRHTTREVEIFEICGGRLADTPGFASLEAKKL